MIQTLNEVLETEGCLEASQVFNGTYYVHKVTDRTCKIYDSKERSCNIQRGLRGIPKCTTQAI